MDVKEMVESVLVDDPVKVVAKKDENRLEVISNDDDIKTDYNYARENYYNLMEKGYDALDELLEIAKSSEHARHFEVASQLIKNLGDTNEKLLTHGSILAILLSVTPIKSFNISFSTISLIFLP